MDGLGLYILDDDGEPVPCNDARQWSTWLSVPGRRVVSQETVAGFQVSTVFLGVDHAFHGGPPVLWETMIFVSGPGRRKTAFDDYQRRYSSRQEALDGHAEAVRMVLQHTVQA
jgi:hypothetical protein